MARYVTRIRLDMRKLNMLITQVPGRADAILDKAAFDIEGKAKVGAAVDTGAMRNSIYVSGASKGSDYSSAVSGAQSAAAGGSALTNGRDISRQIVAEVPASGRYVRVIAAAVYYAIFVELGARGRSGRPFLMPAVEAYRGTLTQAWRALLL